MTVLDVLSKQRLVSLWLLEDHEEEDADYECISGEDKPACLPVTDSEGSFLPCQAVHDGAC